MSKLTYIDVARGLAILGVIVVHTSLFAPHRNLFLSFSWLGQLGVQLFFFTSALTLCLSMEQRGTSGEEIRSFYIRRYFRVAPLYYVGIGLYYGMNLLNAWCGVPNKLVAYTTTGVFSNLFFLHGFTPVSNNNIVPGGWSIGTEMAFYVIFPFLFRWLSSKSARFLRGVIVGYVILMAGVVTVTDHFFFPHFLKNNNFYFFNLFNQLPVFLLGMLFYKNLRSQAQYTPLYIYALMVCGGTGLLEVWFDNGYLSFFLVPLLAGICFYGLMYVLCVRQFSLPLLERIGRYSYSIYILHFMLAVYVFKYIDTHLLADVIPSVTIRYGINLLFTLTGSYLLASLTERFLEKPFIRLGSRLIKRKRAVAFPVKIAS